MKLTIEFDEVRDLIKNRYNKDVTLARVSDNEVCVSLAQKVIIKTIQVSLNLKVENVSNDFALVSYNGGIGVDLIISGVMAFLKAKLPEYSSLVSAEEDHRLRIYLSNIPKLKDMLQKITLRSVAFSDKATEIGFTFKL